MSFTGWADPASEASVASVSLRAASDAFPFPRFNFRNQIRAMVHGMAQGVQFLMKAVPNHAAVLDKQRRIVCERTLDQIGNFRQRRNFGFEFCQQLRLRQRPELLFDCR